MSDEPNVKIVAELVVRRYFEHYQLEVFPDQLAQIITAHNSDVAAHQQQIGDAIKAESSRFKLWLIGLIFTVGLGGGIGLSRLIGRIAGG